VLEAVVGVALRAILASVLLGAVLSVLVLIATRRLALTAATRHALWTTAMIATAVMPLAGIAVSLARATPSEATVTRTLPGTTAATHWHADPPANRVLAPGAAAGAQSSGGVAASATPTPPLALAAWTPRVTRALAIGVVGAWSLGALIGMIGLAASLIRIRGLKRRSSPLDGALADELPWLTAASSGREIYLRLSYEIETPVAIGFGRPVILIPTELAGQGGLAALEPLVLHEHAHLRRYDDWSNLVQRTIERVFWFNPIVWLIGQRIALEREIASDDAVVEKTGEAHAYATSLWRLAREMRMPEHAVVAPGALLTRKQIAVRIEQLLDTNRGRLHRSPGAAIVTALAGIVAVAFVATSAPAVELPAPPEPVPAAWAPPKPAAAVRAPPRVAQAPHQLTKIVIERSAAKPLETAPPRTVYVTPHPAGAKPVTRSSAVTKSVAAETAAPQQVAVAPPVPEPPRVPAPEPSHRVVPAGMKMSREMLTACNGCSFRNADLHGLDLHDLTLKGDDFSGADLRGVNLAGANLIGVSLRRANLGNADLRGAHLSGVELTGASLSGARLDDMTLVGVSLRSPGVSGVSMRSMISRCTGCDLTNVDLHGQDLHGIVLTGADLSHADLHGANLTGAHFMGVDFSGVNLSGADLTNARLDGCDLHGVSLHDAVTTGMTLHGSSQDG
jgi:uncharacterized protein YjbI with pentapeptide repeats/beta-lactamase regulating signal transducer with metallopeptidase domain